MAKATADPFGMTKEGNDKSNLKSNRKSNRKATADPFGMTKKAKAIVDPFDGSVGDKDFSFAFFGF